MLPKLIEITTRTIVNISALLLLPLRKLNILGSMSSSAIELIIDGAFDIYYNALPALERIIPI